MLYSLLGLLPSRERKDLWSQPKLRSQRCSSIPRSLLVGVHNGGDTSVLKRCREVLRPLMPCRNEVVFWRDRPIRMADENYNWEVAGWRLAKRHRGPSNRTS